MKSQAELNEKPSYDFIFEEITDYMFNIPIENQEAYTTAHLALMDSLGCALLALNFPECRKLLGPVVPGAILPGGARVPGTNYELDPVQAAFNIGTMIRWLDFNDTWLAAEWGHPSDNLGAILATADYVSRKRLQQGQASLSMHTVLTAMIKAYEIQGSFALKNSFNRVGLDHVILVKLASAATASFLLGADREEMLRTLSHVFVDGQSLRTYRHAPNTGSRKSWAAGDATARGVRLALLAHLGEMGYPSALTAEGWGFYDVMFQGKTFLFERPFDSYVMENILFKISFPAEFHAQTAVECAVALHPIIKERWDEVAEIEIMTHESAIRIISKEGPLHNEADRDHCLQYMVAIALLYGDLTAEHYEDTVATLPAIDQLREKMRVIENPQFSRDYLDPSKRSITNQLKIIFKDGQTSDTICIEYPLGHKRRREEGIPTLHKKFRHNLSTAYSGAAADKLIQCIQDYDVITSMSVVDFMALWQKQEESLKIFV